MRDSSGKLVEESVLFRLESGELVKRWRLKITRLIPLLVAVLTVAPTVAEAVDIVMFWS